MLEYLESVNIWNKWIFGINTVNTVFLNTNLLATDSSLPSVNSIHLVSDDTPSWKQEQNRNLSHSFYNKTTICEIVNFCRSIIFGGLCRLAESLKYSYKLQLLSSTLYILSSTNRSPWENCNYRRITNVNDHEYDIKILIILQPETNLNEKYFLTFRSFSPYLWFNHIIMNKSNNLLLRQLNMSFHRQVLSQFYSCNTYMETHCFVINSKNWQNTNSNFKTHGNTFCK